MPLPVRLERGLGCPLSNISYSAETGGWGWVPPCLPGCRFCSHSWLPVPFESPSRTKIQGLGVAHFWQLQLAAAAMLFNGTRASRALPDTSLGTGVWVAHFPFSCSSGFPFAGNGGCCRHKDGEFIIANVRIIGRLCNPPRWLANRAFLAIVSKDRRWWNTLSLFILIGKLER